MRRTAHTRLLYPLLSILIAALAGSAHAQSILPFSQNFTHPTGLGTTSLLNFNVSPFDTAVTFQPLAPPDNDWGIAPITSSIDFSGQALHWFLSLDLGNPLFRSHNYSPTNLGTVAHEATYYWGDPLLTIQ